MIYTLSSSTSFCDTLAKEWLENKKDPVWGLSHITAIVPTNRAAKTFKEAFLRQSQGKTVLLPKIISFANMDFLAPDVPPAISPLARQLLLAKLVQKKQPMSEDKAFTLASSLAELIDQMHNYDVNFDSLKEIAPDTFASHWQQTLSFLEIIETYWPEILKQRGELDPALRQIRLIENLISRWHTDPPKNPVIAVGFTGGLPIIEKFLKAVNELPQSDIYIPNLDLSLSKNDWDHLDNTHPEFYIKRLLNALNVKCEQVVSLSPKTDRFSLLSLALKPAQTTADWINEAPALSQNALIGFERIECKTPQTEAFEIACRLREVLQTPEKTAALVTTDRSLARRVRIQMSRWGIELDDSAGTPLPRTPIGVFLILMAEAAVSCKGKDLLTLLKHPLALDGDDFTDFRKKIHAAEKQARKNKLPFCPPLKTDLSAFMNLFVNPIRLPLSTILKAHLSVAESLATSADKSGAERLWAKESGDAASTLLTDLLSLADIVGDIDPVTYPAFLTAVLNTVSVRPKYGMHPRLDILGPIEARLQQPDVVIIGAMNEGAFPQMPEADAWINRPMRATLNLPAPEEKIGVSAQDFMHLAQAKEVVLTRALKVDGTPSIASRWWARLEAVAQSAHLSWPVKNEKFADLLQTKGSFTPATRPAPTPPVLARPKQLSISDITALQSDPYRVYAQRILNLFKLDELDAQTQPEDFGNAVHNALAVFINQPDKSLNNLLNIGKQAFEKERINPKNNPFAWEKFKRIASWFIDENQHLLPAPIKTLSEQSGKMKITLPAGDITLKGRVDRIDIYDHQQVGIIDYKTGLAPTKKQVEAGFAPQLPLEAVMLRQGCFENVPKQKHDVVDLSYWRLIGKANAGEIVHVLPEEKQISKDDFFALTMQRLMSLLALYQQPETPYTACPFTGYAPSYNDYAHLERIAEWQVEENDDEKE